MSSIINQIQSAQKLRGWNLRTVNPVKLFRRSMPLTNPLMRRTAMLVDQVTTATQIRGFGSGKVTPLRDLTLAWMDKIIILVMLVMLVTAVMGLILFNAGNI
jgi:energy-coupling factor transporter transmembrane protein EcfT